MGVREELTRKEREINRHSDRVSLFENLLKKENGDVREELISSREGERLMQSRDKETEER